MRSLRAYCIEYSDVCSSTFDCILLRLVWSIRSNVTPYRQTRKYIIWIFRYFECWSKAARDFFLFFCVLLCSRWRWTCATTIAKTYLPSLMHTNTHNFARIKSKKQLSATIKFTFGMTKCVLNRLKFRLNSCNSNMRRDIHEDNDGCMSCLLCRMCPCGWSGIQIHISQMRRQINDFRSRWDKLDVIILSHRVKCFFLSCLSWDFKEIDDCISLSAVLADETTNI